MSNFNWQTDDETVWDDEMAAAETAVSPPRRLWITLFAVALVIAAAGFVIFRQVNRRVETGIANTQSDILATHNLAQRASLDNDADLFMTLLSGRSKIWSSLQTEAVQEGWLYERSALGLLWLPLHKAASLTLADVQSGASGVELTLDPELNKAELRFPLDYAVAVGNGVTETVVLQQTAVYRRGSERWLLSPPDDEFWGEYTTNQGAMLTLAYPARDTAIAEKLAFDLDAKLDEMCRTLPDLNCPDDLRVHLRLSDELNSLQTPDAQEILMGGLRLELPAPTLVGLPVDEAGYQALYRGYAARVVTAVIPQLVGYECCQHAIFFQALTDYQLSLLGLRPWPVTADDYANVVSEGVDGYELNQVWPRTRPEYLAGEDGWKVYTAVDFILQTNPEISPAEMQRLMLNLPNFRAWLQQLDLASPPATAAADYLALFSREWRQYAFQQTLTDQEPPPIPWPEQDLYLGCLDPAKESFAANLYRLNLDGMAWTNISNDTKAYFVNPLPQKDGLVLQSFGFDSETPATTLWRPDGAPLVIESDHISLGQLSPDGRLLAFGSQNDPNPLLIDIIDCENGSCPLFPLAGLPVWSPDGGDYVLLPSEALADNPLVVNGRTYLFNHAQPPQDWPLHRGGAASVTSRTDEMIALGYGYAPFWVDETTYGYVRQSLISSNSSDHELVLASTMDDQLRILLTEDELMAVAPEAGKENFDLDIGIVLHRLTRPGQLFILAFDASPMAYLFSYDMSTETLDFHFRAEMDYFHSLGMSPNGRYLILAGTDLESGPNPINQILLYDIAGEQFERFVVSNESFFAPANIYDWSSDGDWLAIILDDLSLLLVAPEYGYQRLVLHEAGQCTNVIWLNK